MATNKDYMTSTEQAIDNLSDKVEARFNALKDDLEGKFQAKAASKPWVAIAIAFAVGVVATGGLWVWLG